MFKEANAGALLDEVPVVQMNAATDFEGWFFPRVCLLLFLGVVKLLQEESSFLSLSSSCLIRSSAVTSLSALSSLPFSSLFCSFAFASKSAASSLSQAGAVAPVGTVKFRKLFSESSKRRIASPSSAFAT
jgi:hypothetical protein